MHRRVRHLNPAQCGAQVALDARFIAGVANGALLDTWPSRSVATINATASGTSRPTFLASSINGRPAVQFDGTSDFMSLGAGALSLTNNVSSASINAVVVDDGTSADTTTYVAYLSIGTGTGPRALLTGRFSAASSVRTQGRRLDADGAATSASAGACTSPTVATGRFNWGTNAMSAGANGVFTANTAFASGAGSTSATNSVQARIGGLDATTFRFGGRIAAVIVAVPMFSDALARRIRQHLGFSYRIATA